MLRAFFSSKTRIKLLELFVTNEEKRYYLREISKLLGESLTPIRRELLNLKRVGLLRTTNVANLIYYSVDKEFVLYRELKSMIIKTRKSTTVLASDARLHRHDHTTREVYAA